MCVREGAGERERQSVIQTEREGGRKLERGREKKSTCCCGVRTLNSHNQSLKKQMHKNNQCFGCIHAMPSTEREMTREREGGRERERERERAKKVRERDIYIWREIGEKDGDNERERSRAMKGGCMRSARSSL